jgi:hypothetical protein
LVVYVGTEEIGLRCLVFQANIAGDHVRRAIRAMTAVAYVRCCTKPNAGDSSK